MSVSENIKKIELPVHVVLVAVSKKQSPEKIMEAYHAGQRIFGENIVQELVIKYEALPKDIHWHLIGHLQTNKVKYIAPFVRLIHSVDSFKLLEEINKRAIQNNRIIDCLLQIYIAKEETKFGLSFEEAELVLFSDELKKLQNVSVVGFMGMATNTNDESIVRNEFRSLYTFFTNLKSKTTNLKILSMGMTSDYRIAIEEGSNLVRIGSAIFAAHP